MPQEAYFAGIKGTSFGAAASGATGPSEFSRPSGTVKAGASSADAPPDSHEPPGLVDWLRSDQAQQYQGRWVLLRDDFTVVDAADSPAELLDRHSEERSPRVVLVERPDTDLAV